MLRGRPRCHLSWHSDTCFLIGWEKTIQVCHIIRPPPDDQGIGGVRWSSTAFNDDAESIASTSSINSTSAISSILVPSHHVQLTVQFTLHHDEDFEIICGIATHQSRILVLLYSQRSFESLLAEEITEATEDNLSLEKSPQLLTIDVGEALSAPSLMISDLDSILSSGDDAFEEVSREDVDLRIPPGRGLQGLGLGKLVVYCTLKKIWTSGFFIVIPPQGPLVVFCRL